MATQTRLQVQQHSDSQVIHRGAPVAAICAVGFDVFVCGIGTHAPTQY